jgi:hypothetical protein
VHVAPEFAGHVRQLVEATTAEYELVPQTMHVVATVAADVVEYVPTAQFTQVVTPAVVEYFPVTQSAHTALPVSILYLPAMQAVHVLPFGPVYPTLQIQAATAELASGELELAGHATQAALPVSPL